MSAETRLKLQAEKGTIVANRAEQFAPADRPRESAFFVVQRRARVSRLLSLVVLPPNRLLRWKTMLKLVYCITKKPGMTDEEFFHYWEHVHGPIGARIPGVRRLVQSHRVAVPGDARGADYDGMAELWFDNMGALLEARRSPEWRASSEDEKNFIDRSKVAYFIAAEHPIV